MSPLQPDLPHQALVDQSWFVEFLADRGFAKSSPTIFIRGEASIDVDGTEVHADPGNGAKGRSTHFGDADPASVKAILKQILRTRPFLTEVDLAQERIEHQSLERALTGIGNTIRGSQDTGGGVQFRRFVGNLKEDDIKRALLVAGEIQRWDEVRPDDEQQKGIDEAVGKVEAALRSIPPSDAHIQLKRAREALWEAKDALRRAKELESL